MNSDFPLPYRCLPTQDTHLALIGMATVVDGYPLYYEAANERGLGTVPREGTFGVDLAEYNRGMSTRGLPGGLDSASRFAKVAFTRMNAVCGDSESESVSQFFQILNSVNQQRGLMEVAPGSGKYEITIYSSCINTTTGVYYYKTYGNHQITGVDMHHCDLDAAALATFPLVEGEQINMLN